MKKITFIGIILLVISACNGNENSQKTLTISFLQPINKPAVLYSYFGLSMLPIDTIVPENNTYKLTLTDEYPVGLYSFFIDSINNFDIVVNHEDVEMEVSSGAQVRVIRSRENIVYQAYFNNLQQFNVYIDSLQRAFEQDKTKQTKKEIMNAFTFMAQRFESVSQYLDTVPDSLLSFKIVRALDYPRFDFMKVLGKLPKKYSETDFYQNQFFAAINFNDPRLIRTPYIDNSVNKLFDFYLNTNDEKTIKLLVEKIMAKSLPVKEMFDYQASFLINKFVSLQKMEIAENIASYYLQNSTCDANEKNGSDMKSYLQALLNLREGNKAPDFVIASNANEITSLYKLQEEYNIVFFRKENCPYCEAVSTYIQEVVRGKANIKVVSVTISGSLNGLPQNWINITDSVNEPGAITSKYFVKGAPVVFIINKDKVIVKRIIGSTGVKHMLANSIR